MPEYIKLTFFDWNMASCTSGVAIFFTDDIEKFEKKWLQTGKIEEDLQERYFRSKNGEIVTDYYSEDPELNIVQRGDSEVLCTKTYILEDVAFTATNAYSCQQPYHVDNWTIHVRWIRFKDRYFRIVSYVACGVSMWNELAEKYSEACLWGNPVLEYVIPNKVQYSDNRDDFADNVLATFCELTTGTYESEDAVMEDINKFEITYEFLDVLFADVIGEAG